MNSCSAILLLLVALSVAHAARAPTEEERVKLWHQAKNVWPPNWQEESEGIKKLYDEREKEIMSMTGADERWENWLQFTQSRLVPKFTPMGFKLVKVPESVHARLSKAVADGVADWDNLREEGKIDVIYHPEVNLPKFVDLHGLDWEVIEELREMHEEWGGMKLRPTSAYGVRLYQNGSSLVMHHDKIETHVISSIVHIAHEYYNDSHPWPIQIEDHDGNLHSVNLEPGYMLHYESAKALHGRMRELNGRYYGSIFIHYQPVDRTVWDFSHDDVIAAVPPHWRKGLTEEHGARWAGAAITTDSRATDSAPPRTSVAGTRKNKFQEDEL